MVVAYIIYWLPFHLRNIIQGFGIYIPSAQCYYLEVVTKYLMYLHAVLNPVIYSFMSYGYRNRLVKLWKRVRNIASCIACVSCNTEKNYSWSATRSTKETDSTKIPEKSDQELFPSPNETSNIQREIDSKKNFEPLLKPTC